MTATEVSQDDDFAGEDVQDSAAADASAAFDILKHLPPGAESFLPAPDRPVPAPPAPEPPADSDDDYASEDSPEDRDGECGPLALPTESATFPAGSQPVLPEPPATSLPSMPVEGDTSAGGSEDRVLPALASRPAGEEIFHPESSLPSAPEPPASLAAAVSEDPEGDVFPVGGGTVASGGAVPPPPSGAVADAVVADSATACSEERGVSDLIGGSGSGAKAEADIFDGIGLEDLDGAVADALLAFAPPPASASPSVPDGIPDNGTSDPTSPPATKPSVPADAPVPDGDEGFPDTSGPPDAPVSGSAPATPGASGASGAFPDFPLPDNALGAPGENEAAGKGGDADPGGLFAALDGVDSGTRNFALSGGKDGTTPEDGTVAAAPADPGGVDLDAPFGKGKAGEGGSGDAFPDAGGFRLDGLDALDGSGKTADGASRDPADVFGALEEEGGGFDPAAVFSQFDSNVFPVGDAFGDDPELAALQAEYGQLESDPDQKPDAAPNIFGATARDTRPWPQRLRARLRAEWSRGRAGLRERGWWLLRKAGFRKYWWAYADFAALLLMAAAAAVILAWWWWY